MITEKPLRYNAQNTADVVRVIRRSSHNAHDERSTHCTANDEPLPLRQKNIRVLTKRHKEHVILAKRRNKKMKKDWTKRHKEHVILAKRRNKKMKKDWTKRHKEQTI